jgi:hypothetical protein
MLVISQSGSVEILLISHIIQYIVICHLLT